MHIHNCHLSSEPLQQHREGKKWEGKGIVPSYLFQTPKQMLYDAPSSFNKTGYVQNTPRMSVFAVSF